jgi:signal transduction histidine kinase
MPELVDKSVFHKICEHCVVPMLAVDRKGHILFANIAAEQHFDRSAETLYEWNLADLWPEEKRPQVSALLNRVFTEGKTASLDCGAKPSDASNRKCILATPLSDEQGVTESVVIQFCDSDQHIAGVCERAQQQKMSALCAMAGGLAHHFNNLMGGILTSADFAKESNDPRVLKRALKATIEALNRANELVRSLLTFAEGDRTVYSTGKAVEVARTFVDTLRRRTTQNNIELETQLDPIEAELPSRQLMTILSLLTDNAIEAMPEGGKLRIELSERQGQVLLKVSDTGQGIPKEDLENIFEPFFTTKEMHGKQERVHPGLGLSAVHGIVKEMGGKIKIDSQPGRGTSCTVQIPPQCEI